KSWGPAPPSKLEEYLDRWTRYFAEDPGWSNTFRVHAKAPPGGELDPLTRHVLSRRLAAALAPEHVESSGAPQVKSWGAAPPATAEDYVWGWANYIAAASAREKAKSASTAQATAPPPVEQTVIIPPPPLAPSPLAEALPLAAPPTE